MNSLNKHKLDNKNKVIELISRKEFKNVLIDGSSDYKENGDLLYAAEIKNLESVDWKIKGKIQWLSAEILILVQ